LDGGSGIKVPCVVGLNQNAREEDLWCLKEKIEKVEKYCFYKCWSNQRRRWKWLTCHINTYKQFYIYLMFKCIIISLNYTFGLLSFKNLRFWFPNFQSSILAPIFTPFEKGRSWSSQRWCGKPLKWLNRHVNFFCPLVIKKGDYFSTLL
jgi:hypothetical protein